MLNKKAQGMPMNVIIVAIIVLVVLVFLIAFFAGGFSNIAGKVRDLFTETTTGQARNAVIQTCQNLCDTSLTLPETSQPLSGYCKQSFVVDDDSNPDTKPVRMSCGPDSATPVSTQEDDKKGIFVSGNLAVDCQVTC